MAFQWPTLPDVQYRLTRLRRLIVFATLLPIVAFLLVMAIRWLVVGEAQGGLVLFSIFTLLLISAHAVLFPNATAETMMIAIGLVILIVAAPLAGNSILGWLVLIIAAAVFAIFGQTWLLTWQMGTKTAPTIVTASIRTTAPKEEILAAFADQPERTQPDRRSGPVDEEGRFPVYLTPLHVDDFLGLSDGDIDLDDYITDEDREEATRIAREAEMEMADYAIEHGIPLEPEEDQPHYWTRIIEDTPDYRKASVLTDNGQGVPTEHSVIEHRVEKSGKGWKLTETETIADFQQGLGLGMWLTDYQKDALVMRRDHLEGRPERAIRHAANDSLLTTLAGGVMRWMLRRNKPLPEDGGD